MRILLTASIALLVGACATPITTTVDATEKTDIGMFKTYAWISDEQLRSSDAGAHSLINPVNDRRIRESIDSELMRKGYHRVPLAKADLAVGFTLGTRDKVVVRNNYDHFGYRYFGYHNGFDRFNSRFSRFSSFGRLNRYGYGYGSGFGYNAAIPTARVITEGTLVVDVFDNTEKEALWHGAATKRLSRSTNGSELISEAVDSLLGQFPDSTAMSDSMNGRTST